MSKARGNNSKRSNYTTVERNLAVNLIEKYKHIIEDKSSKSDMREEKKEAWRAVADDFNKSAMITATVTPDQLKKLWQKLKAEFRQDRAENTREVFRTGGGPDHTRPAMDPLIAAAAPYLLEPIVGALDSDSAHLSAVRRRNMLAPAAAGRSTALTDPRLSRRRTSPTPMDPLGVTPPRPPLSDIRSSFASALRGDSAPSDDDEVHVEDETLRRHSPRRSPRGSPRRSSRRSPTRSLTRSITRSPASTSGRRTPLHRSSPMNSFEDDQSRASSSRNRPGRGGSPLRIRTEKQARMKFITDENRRKEEVHTVSMDDMERRTDLELTHHAAEYRHKQRMMELELQMKEDEVKHQKRSNELDLEVREKQLQLLDAKLAIARAQLEK